MRKNSGKILVFLLPSLAVGGTESQSISLALELRDRGWDPVFFLFSKPGEMVQTLEQESLRWEFLEIQFRQNPLLGLLNFISAGRKLASIKPEILYSQLMESNFLGHILANTFLRKSSHIIGIRGYLRLKNQFVAKLFRHVVKKSKLVIVNSSKLINYFPNKLSDHPNVLTISNGVYMRGMTSGNADGIPTVTVLSNFHDYKGHDLLLDSLSMIHSPLRLHLIGDGSKLSEIKRRSALLPPNIQMIFHGLTMDPASTLSASDFLILPSRHEGLPNAVLEAMSVGLPVVAFDIPGVNDLILHEITGLLVKPFDIKPLAHAIERLANDSSLRKQLGKQAYSRAQEFSWERTADMYSSAFDAAIGAN
jgi:glycosyltransferase involved in cell wall biosynthesis